MSVLITANAAAIAGSQLPNAGTFTGTSGSFDYFEYCVSFE